MTYFIVGVASFYAGMAFGYFLEIIEALVDHIEVEKK